MLTCPFCDWQPSDADRADPIDQRTDHYMREHQGVLRALLNPEIQEVSVNA